MTGTPIFHTKLPSDQQMTQENIAMLEYENHKKAKENHQIMVETVHKEVSKVLSLPTMILPHLPRYAHLESSSRYLTALMGQLQQKTYGCMMHDETFMILKDSLFTSNITDLIKYSDMIYGFCASQIIHKAVMMRHCSNSSYQITKDNLQR
jgi:hypothetical protein